MGASQRLRLRDVRAAYRLVGECRDLGADHKAWRRRMVDDLSELLGCHLSLSLVANWQRPQLTPVAFHTKDVLFHGYDRGPSIILEYLDRKEDARDPSCQAHARFCSRTTTYSRRQLVSDSIYYGSVGYNEYRRKAGCDDFVRSVVRLSADGRCHIISVQRAHKDQPFSDRERRLVHLFHLELRRSLGSDLRLPEPGSRALSPRLRQTLCALLDGDSEKQVAARLGLRQSTIHEYVTKLYRYFGVNSRSELMVRCLRYRRKDAFRTDPQPPL